MSQEEKDLLLQDLSARLPYGVKVEIDGYYSHILKGIDGDTISTDRGINYPLRLVKPYLRKMSSMSEEEYNEYRNIDNRSYTCPMAYAHIPAQDRIKWLNKNMFDYRGLIEKGLAIKVTEENNPYRD